MTIFKIPDPSIEEEAALARIEELRRELRHYVAEPTRWVDQIRRVRYCLQAHYIQAISVLERVKESEALWSKLDKLRDQHKLPERTIAALFDAAIGLRIRNSSYRFTLENYDEQISNQLATGDLRAMVQAGLLRQLGAKRGTYYRSAEPLARIAAEVRRNRRQPDAKSLFAA